MSILRSPKAPDAHCDIGDHHFRYALAPHKGSFAESSAVQQGYEFNVPLVISYVRNNCFEARTYSADRKIDIDPSATSAAHQFFDIDKSNVVIDTVKIAEDPIGLDIVVRMYEAHGGRGVAKLVTTIPIVKAHYCNILEDEGSPVEFDANGAILVPYSPFKIVSLKLKVASKK